MSIIAPISIISVDIPLYNNRAIFVTCFAGAVMWRHLTAFQWMIFRLNVTDLESSSVKESDRRKRQGLGYVTRCESPLLCSISNVTW